MERADVWQPNHGYTPRAELVTIKYRCGVVARCVRPDQRRWKPWPGGVVCAWDILSWQPAVGKEYELVWPRQS